jgi:glycerophosphoryl diester phosphodiesterase
LDAMLSADRQVVMCHDLELERCTNGQGAVALWAYSDLLSLDAGSWFAPEFKGQKIPLLTDVIQKLSELNIGLNLEIKPTPGQEIITTQHIAHILHSQWPKQHPLLISSFHQGCLALMRTLCPNIPRGLLTMAIPDDCLIRLDTLDCDGLHCDWRFLTEDWANRIRRAGYSLVVYTVNDSQIARRLCQWGVTAIISDYPHRIHEDLLAITP